MKKRRMLLEEYHVTIWAPASLADARYVTLKRRLISATFRRGLERAVREVLRRYRSFQQVQATVSW